MRKDRFLHSKNNQVNEFLRHDSKQINKNMKHATMIIFMIIHKQLRKHTNETRDYDNLYDNSQAIA